MFNQINISEINYKNIELSDITPYGDHLGIGQAIKGRISSILHWSAAYDARNLIQYYIEWTNANPRELLKPRFTTDPQFIPESQHLLYILNCINLPLNTISSRESSRLIYAFKYRYTEDFQKIFDFYISLKEDATINWNIDTFINAIPKNLKNCNKAEFLKNLRAANSNLSLIQEVTNSLKIALAENLIYDSVGALSGYLYTLLPILDSAFKALTYNLLFESFGVFLASCIIADLSVTIVIGLLSGIYNYKENGCLIGALKGVYEEWNKKVADDNSFHPIVEAFISSAFIALDWLTIDKLEQASLADSYLYNLGIKNFCLKYAVLNAFFTLKSQIHQNDINLSIFTATLGGILRGICKNFLINAIIAPWKLSIASNLASYPAFLSETYLKEWWIKDIISKTFIASTPLWLLKECPTKLISALYFAQEVLEIPINAFSKTGEILGIFLLWSIPNKAYEYLYPKPNIAN